MKQKTHKALSKRIRVTKTGKMMKRHAGQDHFNTRNPGKITRKKRRDHAFSDTHKKAVRDLMPYA
jgi:large subunit ribosomal protein L35